MSPEYLDHLNVPQWDNTWNALCRPSKTGEYLFFVRNDLGFCVYVANSAKIGSKLIHVCADVTSCYLFCRDLLAITPELGFWW